MRHAFAIAAGLLLFSVNFVAAQETQSAENLKSLQAARVEIEGLKKELLALQSGCRNEVATCCPTVASSTHQMIVRRYAWVPASSVGLNTQVVSSGLATSGVNVLSAPAVVSQPQFMTAPAMTAPAMTAPAMTAPAFSAGVLNAPFATGNFATSGFMTQGYAPSGLAASGFVTGLSNGYGYGTGMVGARPFSPASAGVLPASPNVMHSSYGAYSEGTFSQSLGANGYGTGVLGAGFANTPVYPTAVFRRTTGYINAVPAPHYSVY